MHCSTKTTRSLQICGELHEILPDSEKIPGPSQHLQGTQWMEFIVGKEKHDVFNTIMEEKQPSTTQESAKNSSSSQQKKFQREKEAKILKQRKRQSISYKALQPGL
ncbi:hypothetical protein O181_131210 [Austropuccinia psidii MF-1]|uniref:Uncharacterized protein n=1 Tax=Austropuccinia psidii MF-1 TaxID=1389203 RepID=A0A9Q3L0H0_9BASI|nr:hypothetical protein [Austropuccinia psidii MF-1]